MQQIVATLLAAQRDGAKAGADVLPLSGGGKDDYNLHMTFPWVDMVPGSSKPVLTCPPPFRREVKMPLIESMPRDVPRCLKTHLPADAIPYYPKAKYIYVMRDGRDVALSLHNHHLAFTPAALDMMGLPKAPEDFKEFYNTWIHGDGAPFWPFFSHAQGYFDARKKRPNLLLVHFSNLKADLLGQMKNVAAFLEIKISDSQWPGLVEQCTFDYMKKNERFFEVPSVFLQHGSFINKGNSRWREVYDSDMVKAYEEAISRSTTPDLRRYLDTGLLPDTLPA